MKAALGLSIAAVIVASAVAAYVLTTATAIDEDVILVTSEAVPSHMLVIKSGPRPAIRVTRIRPDVVKGPMKWTLPWTCADVKWYSAHFTETQLEAMRVVAQKPKPTPDQMRQIRACIAGKV